MVDSFTPGPVPGRTTMSLGIRDSATAIDSVLWPASFTDRTRVRLTVVGRLNRRYSESMQPSFNNIKGTLYYKLDADGEYVSSMCNGDIVTQFKLSTGYWGEWVRACRTSNNSPVSDATDSTATIGIVSGSGYVKRWSQSQPTWPGYYGCNNGPCVFAVSGVQKITIEPVATILSVSATPADIAKGDSVTFVASAQGLAVAVVAWTWVPDSVEGRAYVSDVETGSCPASSATCKIPVHRTGRMYVRAKVGSGGSQVVEQASARVTSIDCGTGQSMLDDPAIRLRMTQLMYSSNPDDSVTYRRREAVVLVYIRNGQVIFKSPPAESTPCGVHFSVPAPVAGDSLIGWGHTHPYGPGETIQCGNPLTSGADTSTRSYTRSASVEDQVLFGSANTRSGGTLGSNPLYHVPMLIMDKEVVMLYLPTQSGGAGVSTPTITKKWKEGKCTWVR